MASLRRKINLSAAIIVTATLSIFGIYDYVSTERQLQKALEQEISGIESRLQVSLPKPLWDFSNDIAKKFAAAEMGSPSLHSMLVYDANNSLVFGLQSTPEGDVIDVKNEPTGEYLNREVALNIEDSGQQHDVGEVRLYFDDSSMQQQLRENVWSTLIRIAVLVGILLFAIGTIVQRLVNKPLTAMLSHIKDIAEGAGDLTKRVHFESNDELGVLANSVNAFIADIHRIISQLKSMAKQLEDSASLAGKAFDDLRGPLQQQEMELTSLVTALNELTTTSQHVAENAAGASQKVQETNREAAQGLTGVQDASSASNKLLSELDRAEQVINELQQRAVSIGTILDVIRNIAEQTNLLALNAAIEAARAGEQGRGFAVVADEVRVLAKRTQDSTGEIQQMIEQLQAQAGSAVSAMNAGAEQARISAKTTQTTGESFNAINRSIAVITDMNVQIATATEQQNATMKEIDRNVVNIHGAHEKTLAASDTTAESERQLREVVEGLSQLIGRFKV